MIKELVIAIQFMTRIPLKINIEMDEATFGRCSRYFTFIGAIIGALMTLTAYFANMILQPFTTAVILFVGEILLTGGLHLDGFMDTCDGVFSGRKKERILEIMKDSRVGAMGVTGFFVLAIFKLALFMELLSSSVFYPIIFTMPILGRWIMLLAITFYPYARNDGLGIIFRKQANKKSFIVISFISLIPFICFLPNIMLVTVPLTALAAVIFLNGINNTLEGQTGDTYGAINEIAEVIYLFISVIIFRIIL